MSLSLDQAMAVVQAADFKVSKPRKPKSARPMCNALGLPLSPLYDPDYKLRAQLTSIRRLSAPQNFFRRR
jgi:hypothetical protein